MQDTNKLEIFFFFNSNRGSLESKQTASTRKVSVTALIKILAKKEKNTLDLTRAIKTFLKEHMDKPSDKMVRLLQEKVWNKYVCAE